RAGRVRELNERQVGASDDFMAAATEVFVSLTASMESLGQPEPEQAQTWLGGMANAVDAAQANVHEVTRRLPRVELLFGSESPAAAAAAKTLRHLLKMTDLL